MNLAEIRRNIHEALNDLFSHASFSWRCVVFFLHSPPTIFFLPFFLHSFIPSSSYLTRSSGKTGTYSLPFSSSLSPSTPLSLLAFHPQKLQFPKMSNIPSSKDPILPIIPRKDSKPKVGGYLKEKIVARLF